MIHITTQHELAKHQRTSQDVYFEALEEAYGNLPVPSDDWIAITDLLVEFRLSKSRYETLTPASVRAGVMADIARLQEATEEIREHYLEIAEAMNKNCKFG